MKARLISAFQLRMRMSNIAQQNNIYSTRAILQTSAVQTSKYNNGQLQQQIRRLATQKLAKQELHALTARMVSTPSRLFKLVLPIPAIRSSTAESRDNKIKDEDQEDEPSGHNDNSQLTQSSFPSDQHAKHLALLVHPHQPLSHLATLIQSQLPTLKSGRIPSVNFYKPDNTPPVREEVVVPEGHEVVKSGGAGPGIEKPPKRAQGLSEDDQSLVLWSGSTEIGNFVRDCAAGKDEESAGLEGGFVIDIEGTVDKSGVWVTVPSFNDRSLYLRQRYHRLASEIESQLAIKDKCDLEAHKTAQNAALIGFGGLVSWWVLVYYATFRTHLLSGVALGYLWFLYNNREVSYRSILHATISRRQLALYKSSGFDLERWQDLLDEGRALRREIQGVASEYGVRWTGKEEIGEHEEAFMTQEDRKLRGKVEKVLEKDEGDDEDEDEGKEKTEEERKDNRGKKRREKGEGEDN